ncbi:sugar transferase [Brevundimonas sp.]|uniref:sugar transferase n=1 Tax=Brevundimonas sp. TaxID=1871086 RepID=UPI00120D00E8|nr:sugar transferase [Brevundimonas sp.]TAJ59730.1 MAG: sugar transferase [Brevundimonas sp.]
MISYAESKRAFDLLTALALALLIAPLLLMVAAMIRATSPGPALYRQTRIGRHGQPFLIYKFRTMREGEEPAVRRITPAGHILRRYRVDELPQILNIIQGQMSWVGPRPEMETLAALYAENLPGYHERHAVPPGITGWAQINQGHVTGIDNAAIKLTLDRSYAARVSPWLDLLILAKTVPVVLSGSGR